jgi:hypothetical protein
MLAMLVRLGRVIYLLSAAIAVLVLWVAVYQQSEGDAAFLSFVAVIIYLFGVALRYVIAGELPNLAIFNSRADWHSPTEPAE